MARRTIGALGALLVLAGVVNDSGSGPATTSVAPPVAAATPLTTAVPSYPAVSPAPSIAPPQLDSRTGLAMTPPMGWNGFNRFSRTVTAAMVESEARALVDSGLKNAGYTYINLDGGWNTRQRTASGSLQPDPRKFPHGIKPVADYVHSLGLKFGIYTSAGLTNCAGTSAGSYGHYKQDVATFVSWDVDYLKLDWCYIPYWAYPHQSHQQVSQLLALEMHTALAAATRPIVYDLNDWADEAPGSWAKAFSHMWRTAPDSQDTYASMALNFTRNVRQFGSAGPGGWNDPDMLEIGNGGMTVAEYRSQFSLWAEMSAPLIAGNDLTTMSPAIRGILTNVGVIAVDQDPLGRQGYPVLSQSGHWVLTKPLFNGDRAVVLFNQSDAAAEITVTLAQVGLSNGGRYVVLDLWTDAARVANGRITATVEPHGVVMYDISRSPRQSL